MKNWPGTYLYINNNRYKIHEAETSKAKVPKGKISIQGDKILIGLNDQSIKVLKIQPPGKKAMSSGDFINGLGKNYKLEITDQK